MYRTFGFQTLSGSAQPLFADKLTAAMPIPPDGVDPIMNVANTALYQDGDRITLDPGGADQDTVLVVTILSPTKMQVSSQGAPLHAHAINTVTALDLVCAQLLFTTPAGNAGNLYIGADGTVTNVGGGSAFTYCTVTGSFNLGQAQWNQLRTTDAWMAGTMGDKVGIAAYIV